MTVIHTQLTDGTPVCIREVREDDEARLREGIAKLSQHSRYLRFFSGMSVPPPTVIDKLVSADGHDHIAWGAIKTSDPGLPALGVVHAFRDPDDPASADFSVAVLDDYHGLGLARLLTAVVLFDARAENLTELNVQILSENKAALGLTRALGGHYVGQDHGVAEFEIVIDDAIQSLRDNESIKGLVPIFDHFA